MKLIKDDWMPMFEMAYQLEKQLSRDYWAGINKHEQGMHADYRASQVLMAVSETIVLPSSIMMDLVHNIDRIDTRGSFLLPYPYLLIQFTTPIREEDIMVHIEKNELQEKSGFLEDRVQGILMANALQDDKYPLPNHVFNMMNCCILFESTSVNRVVWQGTDKPAEPKWDKFMADPAEMSKESLENKQRMIALCYAINLFLNAPNVIIQKETPDPKVNEKRVRKGKAKLPEYHTVTIQKWTTVYAKPSGRTGKEHGRMYPVRGHFRKLPQFVDPIWVPNHFRGLKHGPESMRPEVYKVASPKR